MWKVSQELVSDWMCIKIWFRLKSEHWGGKNETDQHRARLKTLRENEQHANLSFWGALYLFKMGLWVLPHTPVSLCSALQHSDAAKNLNVQNVTQMNFLRISGDRSLLAFLPRMRMCFDCLDLSLLLRGNLFLFQTIILLPDIWRGVKDQSGWSDFFSSSRSALDSFFPSLILTS